MGKSLPTAKLPQQLAKPTSQTHLTAESAEDLTRPRLERKMERNGGCSGGGGGGGEGQSQRTPLSRVVSDCVRRWFQDTLKEAKGGDLAMQVLVGQMYFNGYGVPQDAQKGTIWMTRASRVRSSVWKVSNKRPGYNATDSDSDESEGNS